MKWLLAICLVAFAAAEVEKREISANPALPAAAADYRYPGLNEIPYGPGAPYPNGPYGPVEGPFDPNGGQWQGPDPWTQPGPWHGNGPAPWHGNGPAPWHGHGPSPGGNPHDKWHPEYDNHQRWHAVWEYSAIPHSHTTVDVQNPEVGPASPHSAIEW